MEVTRCSTIVKKDKHNGHSHVSGQRFDNSIPSVYIVGNPNVGKSVLFNQLTGTYVSVSNFPGTTVELSRGIGQINTTKFNVIDTPGMYRFFPISEDELVAQEILLHDRPDLVIHVIDAKNITRMLPLTLQLLEAGLTVILDLNLMDEARNLGVEIDIKKLERNLGIPVVATTLTSKNGGVHLKERLVAQLENNSHEKASHKNSSHIQYPPDIEIALQEIEKYLQSSYPIRTRAIATLVLQKDYNVTELVREREGSRHTKILSIAKGVQAKFEAPSSLLIAESLNKASKKILAGAFKAGGKKQKGIAGKLSEAMIKPTTGIPIMLLALLIMYALVGVLGAQTLVAFLEESVFGSIVNPWMEQWIDQAIPWPVLRSLFGGEFGIFTMGLRYAVAIILPLVATFFLSFSIIEDSGYLPRLAMLIDRVFKKIGLNGRAVIPLVLGFGCTTMATIVTRTLETRRERLLSTIFLALAIPCSAQLGVMLGLMAGQPTLLAIWSSTVAGILLLVGYLANKIIPGEKANFYMELPPLRLPKISNIFVKTYTRMEWYFREVLPLFILASLLIWLGKLSGLFDLIVGGLEPLVEWMGLPRETAVAFLFGFFRRDYGAAGLFDLRNTLSGAQLLVAATAMTLFVPCIAQFAVTIKERGFKTALAISAFIFPFAFLVASLLFRVLSIFEVS